MNSPRVFAIDGVVPVVDPTAFVHPTAVLIGDVIVGPGCYIGPCASLRGDFGRLILQAGVNVQDTCVIHSFPEHDTVVEVNGHIGHGAVLHCCTVRRNALVGMNAVVMDNAVIGENSFVAACSFVKVGMEVPDDAPYTNEPWPQQQKNHAAMITRMDRDIGRLIELLQQLGVDENTLIVFSSDNGPHREGGNDPSFFNSSGGLRGIKRSLHEGGIRVPLIARWPGQVPSGSTSDHVGAFWDVLPTLAETFPSIDWHEQGRYFFSRVVQHGQRRAEEMRESAHTVREAGMAPLMASAIAAKQQWVADLARAGVFADLAKDARWQDYADRVLGSVRGNATGH